MTCKRPNIENTDKKILIFLKKHFISFKLKLFNKFVNINIINENNIPLMSFFIDDTISNEKDNKLNRLLFLNLYPSLYTHNIINNIENDNK